VLNYRSFCDSWATASVNFIRDNTVNRSARNCYECPSGSPATPPTINISTPSLRTYVQPYKTLITDKGPQHSIFGCCGSWSAYDGNYYQRCALAKCIMMSASQLHRSKHRLPSVSCPLWQHPARPKTWLLWTPVYINVFLCICPGLSNAPRLLMDL